MCLIQKNKLKIWRATMSDIMKIIDNDEFIFFLSWLDEWNNWEAREIISVVQRPSGYQKEYDEYLEYKKEKVNGE